MKILITGGAGFIGSNIADKYIEQGHQVSIVDNLSTGKRENLPKKAMFYEADIREADKVKDIVAREKPEIISHHAAQLDVRRSVADPVYDASVNILGLLNVLEAAAENARKVIYISSGGVIYGEPKKLPVSEGAPKMPLSPYGIAKLTGEHYLNFYNKIKGLNYTIFRYSNVYGPRQDPHGEAGVIAIFSQLLVEGKTPKIFGNGEQTRDYIYIDDVVAANVAALSGGDNEAFNIGTGKETSVNELFEIMRKAFEYSGKAEYLPVRAGELMYNSLAIDKAKKILDWQPEVELIEGVSRTVKWLRDNGTH